MSKAVLSAALIIGILGFGAAASSGPFNSVSVEVGDRTAAAKAFIEGDFEPYKKYLEDSLAWHLRRLEAQAFDEGKIRGRIKEEAKKRKVKLSEADIKNKVEESRRLIQGAGGGWLQIDRERVRSLYEMLSRLCSITSDSECELAYRKLAAQYE